MGGSREGVAVVVLKDERRRGAQTTAVADDEATGCEGLAAW